MRDNFYIYTDRDGKMPFLSYKPIRSVSHIHYVRYLGNRPVECAPYPGQSRVWDYSRCEYVDLDTIKTVRRVA